MNTNLRILQIQTLVLATARHDFYYARADDRGAHNAGVKSHNELRVLQSAIKDTHLALAIWKHFDPEN